MIETRNSINWIELNKNKMVGLIRDRQISDYKYKNPKFD